MINSLRKQTTYQQVVILDLDSQSFCDCFVYHEPGARNEDVLARVGEGRDGQLDGVRAAAAQDHVVSAHGPLVRAVLRHGLPRVLVAHHGPVPSARVPFYALPHGLQDLFRWIQIPERSRIPWNLNTGRDFLRIIIHLLT